MCLRKKEKDGWSRGDDETALITGYYQPAERLYNNNKWRPSVSPSVIGYNKKSADGKHTY